MSRTYLSLQLGVPFRLAVLPLDLVPGHSQVGPVAEPLERHVEERQHEEQEHREPQPAHHQCHGMAHRARQGPMRERGKLGETVHGIPAADGPQQAGQQRQLQELDQVPEREDALEAAGRIDARDLDTQRLDAEVEAAGDGAGGNGGRTDRQQDGQRAPAQITKMRQRRLQRIQEVHPHLAIKGEGAGHQPSHAVGQRRAHQGKRPHAGTHHQQVRHIPRTGNVTLFARLPQALLRSR